MSNPVSAHYASAGIAERVLAAFRAGNGADAAVTPDGLAPIDHFHGRGVVATEGLAALLQPAPGERLLDIGCGIGGPARWLAARFGCAVTGIDLTPAFCAAARALTAACGLAERVAVVAGSALDLPFPDNRFDRAYSQNVVMNIADKRRFYGEAFRVLRPGGVLALSNVCAGPAGEPYFPVPWATTAAASFLASVAAMHADLVAAGFAIERFEDTTEAMLPGLLRQRERLERGVRAQTAADILLGPGAPEMQLNSTRTVIDGRGRLVEALVRKPR